MDATSRLFLALWPPPTLQQALGVLARTLSARIGGRVVSEHNIHLTLAFLGEVAAPLRQRLESALDACCGVPAPSAQAEEPADAAAAVSAATQAAGESFVLTLDRLGSFGTGVAWVGAQRVPPALCALHALVAGQLAGIGIAQEDRAFAAHLTLLRRTRGPLRSELREALRWEVTAFRLVASELNRDGSRYRCLREWPLPRSGSAR